MMKLQKLIIMPAAALLLASALVAAGCAGAPQPEKAAGIFANEAEGLLSVRNETGIDMMLFAGTVEGGIVLGGIPALSSRSFDIAKIEGISGQGAFMLRGVPAETYRQKTASLSGGDVLYSGVVVFDLPGAVKIEKVISGKIDETMSFSVTASNDSPAVCELRLDSPDGPAIAALSPFEQLRRIWLNPLEDGQPRFIWPVYVFLGADGTVEIFTDHIERRFPQPGEGDFFPLHLHGAVDDVVMPLLFE